MRHTLKWVLVGSSITVVFCGGFIVGVLSHVGDPVALVDVVNQTSTAIRKVTVSHEHGTAVTLGIEPGQSKRLKFFAPGETSYRTSIELANGQEMEGPEHYAEAGYRITENCDREWD